MRTSALALVALCFMPSGWAQPSSLDIAVPRTKEGRPDFQGQWSAYLLTPFERQDISPAVKVTGDEAATQLKLLTALDDARAKSRLETEGEEGLATELAFVDGSYRTSLVVDPPDGRIPRSPGYPRPPNPVLGPEAYSPYTRCVAGAGVAPLLIAPLDMLRRIVQTSDAIVIHSENQNDVRVLHVGGEAPSPRWTHRNGYSAAHWVDDTLTIETTNFGDPQDIRYQFGPINHVAISSAATLTETLRYAANGDLIYRFTLSDPRFYTRAWTGEYNMKRTNQVMVDAGCHEANYAVPGMLRGAAVDQKRAASK